MTSGGLERTSLMAANLAWSARPTRRFVDAISLATAMVAREGNAQAQGAGGLSIEG